MSLRFFSDKDRPVHLGSYPLERLARSEQTNNPQQFPAFRPLNFQLPNAPESIINAMGEHQAMLDAIRDGLVNKTIADCPTDLQERADHLKAFGYYVDASMVGTCRVSTDVMLAQAVRNSDIDRLADDLRHRQTRTLASGIDMIMADLRDSMNAPPSTIDGHTHAVVFLVEYPRDPEIDEPGCDWIIDSQAHRACLLAAEAAIVIANYVRLLGFDARAHTGTSTDVDLNRLAVSAGLTTLENGDYLNPYIGDQFGVSAITTTFELAVDQPLIALAAQPHKRTHGLAWQLGKGFAKNASNHKRYAKRRFVDGEQPFEMLKRVDKPTTFIDEARVARVPKRTDMFARAQFGDMGKTLQENAKGGHYARKAAPSMAQRRALGAFVLLQDGEANSVRTQLDPQQASDLVKASSYFLGADAVGISRCPEWSWYSHDATGNVIEPTHDQAISMIIDQGYSTMAGSSGDDWIAVSQSMRAYLRFSLLGGVLAKQLRNLGYSAKAHTVLDGDVLQPPLLLLSGLGEVSRIGEVILNPYLGPRLKSGVVTTNLPMVHDKPIDFGLQTFCESCNKCARECPSGAITAGPKLMFNGYEIWKSDSQKCTSYRIGQTGGAMCGRCMKTCPWNLEGLFAEKPFRWAAMNIPKSAPLLAKLDDAMDKGSLNPVKKWWWDLEISEDGGYRPARHPVNVRTLQKNLQLKYEDQTLAVYPANLAPHPYPYPFHMNREKGIEAYQALITAEEYQRRLAKGETKNLAHRYAADGDSPVVQVELCKVEQMCADICKYEFRAINSEPLPEWSAGAHIDIVITPEFIRQYSMSGNPADRNVYQIGVLREEHGRGGSQMMHRIFVEGRKLFISKPINHFPLIETAGFYYLLGGGIGITPMIAMAHRLHSLGKDFELHYSGHSRASMSYLPDLEGFVWADRVQLHVSDENGRAKFEDIFKAVKPESHVYCCGAEHFMAAAIQAAERAGIPENCRHLEYFSVPEAPDYINHDFKIKLASSGQELVVPADKSAAQVLKDAGFDIKLKCSDGLCGICQCSLLGGDVEHRDFVLSNSQRARSIILCQSRASKAGGVIEIDL